MGFVTSIGLELTKGVGKHVIKLVADKLRHSRASMQRELGELERSFGRVEELARFYVEPDCQASNPIDDDRTLTSTTPAIEHIMQFLDVPIAGQDGTGTLFVLADAGMGKTSLLVVLKLAALASAWPSELSCVLLRITPDVEMTLSRIERPGRTVLLLDSLDEDPSMWERNASASEPESREADPGWIRLMKLLNAAKSFHRTIITCRTQFLPPGYFLSQNTIGRKEEFLPNTKRWIGGFRVPVTYLSPFSDRHVETYLVRRYGRKDDPRFRQAFAIAAQMGSFRCRPMLLSYIEDLRECTFSTDTEFEVYEHLVEQWLKREEAKASGHKRYHITAERLHAGVTLLALHGQRSGQSTFSRDLIKQIGRTLNEIHAVEHIDYGGRSLVNLTSTGEFRFAHLSIQEFLVAWCGVFGSNALVHYHPHASDLLRRFVTQGLTVRKVRRAGDLRGVKVLAVCLGPFDFRGSDLCKADFSGSDISGATLIECEVEGANFSGATLKRTRLTRAHVTGSKFDSANLENADFFRADLSNANFVNANLDGASLEEANLTGAVFTGARLGRASLASAQLSNADFSGADLAGAQLQGAALETAKFCNANLRAARLCNASLVHVHLSEANLANADLSQANLHCTDLSGADLSAANLRGADLTGADLTRANLSAANLTGADLTGADLTRANLSVANLTGADLSAANLGGANLTLADFKEANLAGAKLWHANLDRAQITSAQIASARSLSSNPLSRSTYPPGTPDRNKK